MRHGMKRGELPRNTGTDGDGVAQREGDHFEKCPACSQWFDMRDLAQASSTSTTVRLKFWKGRSHAAKGRCNKKTVQCGPTSPQLNAVAARLLAKPRPL